MEYINGVAVGTPTFTIDGTLSGAPVVVAVMNPATGIIYYVKFYPTKS